ncbi:hypothetical protein MG1601_368 [Mycoplasmoides gallisepticum]
MAKQMHGKHQKHVRFLYLAPYWKHSFDTVKIAYHAFFVSKWQKLANI